MIQINGWKVTMTTEDLDELNGEVQVRENEVERLEQQLTDCRKYLAESVAKECKCETNTAVNNDMADRNLKLQKQIKEAERLLKTVLDDEYDLFDIEKYIERNENG